MAGQGTVVVNFGSGSVDASASVTGQTGILGTSLAEAWLFPVATADNGVDDHLLEEFDTPIAYNITPGVGFSIYLKCMNGLAFGQYTVAWVWN